MNLSFQEKSLWVMFIGLLSACGFYLNLILPVQTVNILPEQIIFFVLAVVLLVSTQVVGHILVALIDRRAITDERDQLIALKGNRNGSYVLATGVFLALCCVILTEGTFIFTHVLLGFWTLAQLVEIGSQLVAYRREA